LKERAMTLNRRQAAERPILATGASAQPAVFVDGRRSGTTGSGIQERLRQQSDVVVKSIAEEKRRMRRPSAR